MRRSAFRAGVLCALASGLAGCGAGFKLTAAPGETPGITLGPFNGDSGADATSTLTLESQNGFSQQVNFKTTCCFDAIRNRWIDFGTWQEYTSANPVYLSANATVTTPLSIHAGSNSILGPNMPFGKYNVRVVATSQDGSTSTSANVGTKILPRGFTEPSPYCRPSDDLIPLGSGMTPGPPSLVDLQIAAAEASPRTTHLVVAVFAHDKRDVWRLEIDDDQLILPTEALVVLQNNTGSQKIVTSVGCSSSSTNGKEVTVQASQGGQIKIVQGEDRTIVFQKRVCHDPFCWGWHMEDVSTFSLRFFWSVFGGKRMSFTWLQD